MSEHALQGASSDDYMPVRTSRIGHTLAGKYLLEAVLGEGGMGTVYRARQLSVGREVAVKLLRSAFADDESVTARFLREVRIATDLSHPGIVTVFDFGCTAGNELYLAMELLRGRTLREELERGPLTLGRAADVMAQVCEALHYAHEAGLVHRDLKPDNVFLLDHPGLIGDKVKVLDFGLARPIADDSRRLTRTGVICGTPHYLSPEQARGEEVGRSGDIYSLGILLFEMLTGRLPFDSESSLSVLMSHVQDVAPRLRETEPRLEAPDALEELVASCLAKAPADRPRSALELRERLLASIAGSDRHRLYAPPPAPPPRRPPAGGEELTQTELAVVPRRRWLPRLAAAVTLAATFAGGWLLSDSSATPEPEVAEAATTPSPETATSPAPSEPATAAISPPPIVDEAVETTPRQSARFEARRTRRQGESAASSVLIDVDSSPAGAQIWRDGVLVGTAPARALRPRDGETVSLVARLPGHREAQVELSGSTGGPISMKLSRRPSRRPRPAPTAAVRAPRQNGPVILE